MVVFCQPSCRGLPRARLCSEEWRIFPNLSERGRHWDAHGHVRLCREALCRVDTQRLGSRLPAFMASINLEELWRRRDELMHALDEPFAALLACVGLGASVLGAAASARDRWLMDRPELGEMLQFLDEARVVLAARLLLDPTSHKPVEDTSTKRRKGARKKAESKAKLVESRWLLHRREDELVDAALAVDEQGLHEKARELEKALWPEFTALYGTTAMRREALTLACKQQDMVAAHRVLYAINLEEDDDRGGKITEK